MKMEMENGMKTLIHDTVFLKNQRVVFNAKGVQSI